MSEFLSFYANWLKEQEEKLSKEDFEQLLIEEDIIIKPKL